MLCESDGALCADGRGPTNTNSTLPGTDIKMIKPMIRRVMLREFDNAGG